MRATLQVNFSKKRSRVRNIFPLRNIPVGTCSPQNLLLQKSPTHQKPKLTKSALHLITVESRRAKISSILLLLFLRQCFRCFFFCKHKLKNSFYQLRFNFLYCVGRMSGIVNIIKCLCWRQTCSRLFAST